MSAFAHCYDLENIMIPASVLRIDDYAFGYCMKLPSIAIPSSVTNIGVGVFAGCGGMESIEVEVITASSRARAIVNRKLMNKLIADAKSIIPAEVVEIGECALCKSPNSGRLRYRRPLNQDSFYNCATLRDLVIPSSVNVSKQCFFPLRFAEYCYSRIGYRTRRKCFYNCLLPFTWKRKQTPRLVRLNKDMWFRSLGYKQTID